MQLTKRRSLRQTVESPRWKVLSKDRRLSRGLRLGLLSIVLSLLGFYLVVSTDIVIATAATPTVKVELVSQPPGAEIWLNGKKHSSAAPATLSIGRDATLSLELRQKGYQTRIWRDETRLRQKSSIKALHLFMVMEQEVEPPQKPTPAPFMQDVKGMLPTTPAKLEASTPPPPPPRGYCGFDFPRSEAVVRAPTLPSFSQHDKLRRCVTEDHYKEPRDVALLEAATDITESQIERPSAQGDVLVDLAQLYHERGGAEGYQSCLNALGQAVKRGIPNTCKQLRARLLKLNCSQKYQARTSPRPPPGLFPDVKSGAKELLDELDNVEEDMSSKENHACWAEVKKDVVSLQSK